MDSFLINFIVNPQSTQNSTFYFFVIFIMIWSIIIKGFALYHAARHEEKLWFVAILLLNIFGILELIYLFFLSKQKMTIQEVNINLNKLLTGLKQKNPLNKKQSSKK